MIQPEWPRVAAIHALDDGNMGAVWLAHDRDTDTVHLYDCCVFKVEVLAVIAEALNARGRFIPVAWKDQDLADQLLERGCNMLPEAAKETGPLAEVISRDVWERMRTGRFKVDKRLSEWLEEFKSFRRKDSKVPLDSHPLMAATRHAIGQLNFGRRRIAKGARKANHPNVAVL